MQSGSDSSPVPLAESLCAAFQHTVARQPDALAFVALDDAQRYTWRDYADEVERVASALHGLGVRRGDTVGIMLRNRPEFHFVDTGALHLGAIPVSIYNTLPAEDVAWVLNDAAASVVVSEQMFARVLEEAVRHGWKKKALVFVDSTPRLTDVISSADEFDFEGSWRRVRQLDLATISYTSGTTGPPKGVELTQRSVLGILAELARVVGTVPDARVVS
jgi:long-chain acyl-CoA synthetase